jgi:chemotaxis protein CheX
MAGLNSDHINPFLIAATKVLKDMCAVNLQIGKPYIKNTEFTQGTLIIMIGITGEIRGQAMIAFPYGVACEIASKMICMPVTVLDELSTSAICELGNMIMGNTATIFSTKGIGIDITPPTLCTGNVSFSNNYSQNICVPLHYDGGGSIEINIAIK